MIEQHKSARHERSRGREKQPGSVSGKELVLVVVVSFIIFAAAVSLSMLKQ